MDTTDKPLTATEVLLRQAHAPDIPHPYAHRKIFEQSLRDFQANSIIYQAKDATELDIVDATRPWQEIADSFKQSRLESLLETAVNIGTGFFVSWAVWLWVASPLFGIPVHFAESLGLTALFTVTSVARSYIWRRFFNAGLNRKIRSWTQ